MTATYCKKHIAIIIMCYNSEKTIKQVLTSYKDFEIHIFIDNKTNDNTRQLCLGHRLYNLNFIDFEQARNNCLTHVGAATKKEYIMFVDDSYIIKFNKVIQELTDNLYNVGIGDTNNVVYRSIRLFKTSSKPRYVGKVHEAVVGKSSACDMFTLYDCYKDEDRTNNRLNIDILSLGNDGRSLYYKSMISLKLYLINNTNNLHEVKNYHLKALACYDLCSEEKFILMLNLGGFDDDSWFDKAAEIFPSRSGEAYYKRYMKTGDDDYLTRAYKNMEVGESLYPRNTLIGYCINKSYIYRLCSPSSDK